MTSWLVYACRTDYAADVAGIIARTGGTVAAFVDNLGNASPHDDGLGPVVLAEDLDDEQRALPAAVPLITPGHRFTAVGQARAAGVGRFPALVDPTSVVAGDVSAGEGAVVNAGVVVAARASLGAFSHVNRSASVGHHSILEPYTTLGPGALLAGRVHVCTGAFVGAGAVCTPTVRIGANSVVGAGAVVLRDVPPGVVVVGNPARVVRESPHGYGGVSVPL